MKKSLTGLLEMTLVMGLAGAGCSSPPATMEAPDLAQGAAAPEDASMVAADLGPMSCAPALTIGPATPVVNPFGLATFKGTGGTGAYRFKLVNAPSGSIINELSGAYLAGGKTGVEDEIEITDAGCIGAARVKVRVVPRIGVRPQSATVPPMTKFTVDVSGGSGMFNYTLLQAGSNATVSARGEYAAGARTGLDSIKVVDLATGDSAVADIAVDPGAQLLPDPPLVILPAGATFKLKVRGGSGFVDVAANGNAAAYADGLITSMMPGTSTLDLTDHYSGQKARVRVDVAPAQKFPSTRAGDQFSAGLIASARTGSGAWRDMDLDGDGFADAILGNSEADVGAYNGGAVYIYKGGMGGPAGKPDRVIAGENREDWLGRGVAVGDFDGDGELDVAIGAPRADVGLTDNGAVYIYKGIGNGLLSDKPAQILSGQLSFDYFGWALAPGDFNGDGRLDLAVAAYLAEDTQAMPRTNDQGAVSIFLGYPDGFLTRPDAIVYGQTPDPNGGWRGVTSLQMGFSLAAADVDGDGKCDLLAGTPNYNSTTVNANPDASRSTDGAVWVFAGVGPNGPSAGGVRTTPSRFYAGADADPNSQFGRSVSAGDLDGDGKAEIIIGQPYADSPGPNNTTLANAGAVRVFAGGALPMAPPSTWTAASKAEASYLGPTANNYLGFSVSSGEATGDALPDLIVGHWIDDLVIADGGAVRVFAGRKGSLPDVTATRAIGGVQQGERLGQAVASIGDMDGDGKNDLVALAGFTDVNDATDIGSPYFIDGTAMAKPKLLDMPGQPAGAWTGYSNALLDFNNDGFTDLVVGAPLADPVLPTKPQSGINAGLVHVYLGTANGIPADASMTIKQFLGHSEADQFGWRVAAAGDFDGDGLQDLAVVARVEDVPSSFTDTRFDNTGCAEKARTDSGAVYVFRGSRGGMPSNEPAFILYGPQASYRIDTLAGGFDVNGDGKSDLVIGSPEWRNSVPARTGGFMIITGRAAVANKTKVMCDPALVAYGLEVNALLAGFAVAGVPDLDGDGCAEVAIGATEEQLVNNIAAKVTAQGTVRVVYGWGGTKCPARPRLTLLRSNDSGSRMGVSISAADIDRDGLAELGIGAYNHVTVGATPGGAWLVPGTYLKSLAAGAVTIAQSGDLPEPPANTVLPMGQPGRFLVEGVVTGELFGQGVALLPDVGNGRGGMAVGAPYANASGVNLAGAVRVFQFLGANSGLDPYPVAVLGGETARPGARVGESVVAGRVANAPAIAAGAILSSGVVLDSGSSYVAPIRLP